MHQTLARPSLQLLPTLIGTLLLFCASEAFAGFAHPGVAHSAESIAFIRAKLEAKQQPWTETWDILTASPEASLSWEPNPIAQVERGAFNNPNIGSSDFSADAAVAYVHALRWALSGETAHPRKAADIVDAWSGTLKSISNHDARLLVGMSGYKFTIAAELLKHTWDASMLQTMMAMGVFLDDQVMFDRAKNYFLAGKGNGAIGNYFKESGQCQETGRDQGHTQMGLDFLAATCETAWIQGIDLYGALHNRLLKGFDYTAKYNLGFDVPYEPYEPYEPYRSFEGRYYYKTISDDARGRFRPMYERVFNHYHNRKRLEAPFTWQAVERLRAGSDDGGRRRSRATATLETLMFANQPAHFVTDTTKRTAESSPVPANAAAPQANVLKPDRLITYKTVGEVMLKLHVFEPDGLKTNDMRPAIVFFFGGGWAGGDPKQFYQQARALADLGMVAFSAEYRVKSRNQTTPFECVKDGKSTIRWVRENAARLGVDPKRIVAAGGSAGGHVAACTGIIDGCEEEGENLDVSSVPNAMILFNPVLDTTEEGYGAKNFTVAQQTELSPCHHVVKGIVPTIVFHGTADQTVPFENAERFARLMKEADNDGVLVSFDEKGHGFFNSTFFRPNSDGVDYDLTMKRSVEFLTAHDCLAAKK